MASERTEVSLLMSVNDFQATKVFCNREDKDWRTSKVFCNQLLQRQKKIESLLQELRDYKRRQTMTEVKVKWRSTNNSSRCWRRIAVIDRCWRRIAAIDRCWRRTAVIGRCWRENALILTDACLVRDVIREDAEGFCRQGDKQRSERAKIVSLTAVID